MDNLANDFARGVSIHRGSGDNSGRGRGPGQRSQRQAQNAPAQASTDPPLHRIPVLSEYSSSGTHDCAWASQDFLLGAGMVIIQKNTNKIVVVHETEKKYWFFPRGRKDTWESVEEAALREAYEESGYRVKFLRIWNPHRQPPAKGTEEEFANVPLFTEPVYMTIVAYHPQKKRSGGIRPGGQYLTTWYVGEISEDAVPESGTGMHDEQNFKSYLMTYKEAMERVYGKEKMVLKYVWKLYEETLSFYHTHDQVHRVVESALNDPSEWEPEEESAHTDNQAALPL